MKKRSSRLLSAVLSCALIVMLLPAFATTASAAAPNGVRERLKILEQKYKAGTYWNHPVTQPSEGGDYLMWTSHDERFAESTSDVPCDHHADGYSGDYVGLRDCNYFDGGLQCVGFANRLFYELFDGHRRSDMEHRTDWENIQVGDYVRFAPYDGSVNGHSVIVLEKNGSVITVAECNYGSAKCGIRWNEKYDLNASSDGYPFCYYCHADNYDTVNNLGIDFCASIYYPHGNCNLKNENGNVVLAAPSNGFHAAEIWHFVWTPEGYEITSLSDKRCLDAAGRGTEPGTNVQVYDDNDTPAQRWILSCDTGGRGGCYNLIAAYPNSNSLVVDVYNEDTAAGTNVHLWNAKSNAAQAFEIHINNFYTAIFGFIPRMDSLSE